MHFLSSGQTNVILLWLSTITPSAAFLPTHQGVVPISTSDKSQSWTSTNLNMAFDSSQGTNIYDGPMALTRERDACGVGFVANPTEGELVRSFVYLLI